MKNILFLSHSSELNGAELMLIQTLERLDRTRFKSVLVIPRPGPLKKYADESGIETIIVPMKWWLSDRTHVWRQPFAWIWNIQSIIILLNIIRNRNIHLVFTNSAVGFSGALASKISRRLHVWYLHEILGGNDIQLRCFLGKKWLTNFISAYSCRVLGNSRATLDHFSDPSKTRLVYNGIAKTENPDQSFLGTRKELGWEEDDIILGMVGRVCPEKGQMEALEAFALLKVEFPTLKLLVIGEIKDKKYFLKIEKRVQRLSLKEDVLFAGRMENIINVIHTMDFLIVASRSESFGRVIIEAMSVKTPVVAVRSGGIPEIIENGINGFLVPSNDPNDLVSIVRPILENREIAASAALKAVETVEKKFNIDMQIKMIETIIEECIDQ
jgi:glycosyltransferase involved in cell wall biosynthesis